MLSQIALFVTQVAEESSDEGGINPWFVGGGALAFLLLLMIALVAFGGGREHS